MAPRGGKIGLIHARHILACFGLQRLCVVLLLLIVRYEGMAISPCVRLWGGGVLYLDGETLRLTVCENITDDDRIGGRRVTSYSMASPNVALDEGVQRKGLLLQAVRTSAG